MGLHYNAFISYKHAPADIAVAKDIQHQLEHYRVPKAVREKTGRDKIERIFRDQEELPITSDLSKDIDYALQDAEYLIVICSSSTKLSTWVPREIARFMEFHDRNHILTVLVDGEPNEVIPKILLEETQKEIDADGVEHEKVRIYEPLSCDYREGIRQARKTEIPRLAAALLGCSYDELINRARQYKMRRLTAITSVGAVMAATAIGYLIWSNRQIQSNYERAEENRILAEENYQKAEENWQLAEENRAQAQANFEQAEANYKEAQANLLEARRNQITYLANEAVFAHNQDDRIKAVQLALAALPGKGREDWPVLPIAENVLARSVGAYEPYTASSKYADVWEMEMRGNILDMKIERSQGLLYAYDYFNDIAAWDLNNYKELFHIKPAREIMRITLLTHPGGTDLLVDDEDGIHLLDGLSGDTKWTFNKEELGKTVLGISSYVSEDSQVFAFVTTFDSSVSPTAYYTILCCLDPEDGRVIWNTEPTPALGSRISAAVWDPEAEILYFAEENNQKAGLFCCGKEDKLIREIPMELDYCVIKHLFKPADGRIVVYGVVDREHLGSYSLDGNTVFVYHHGMLLCLDPENGETVWTNGFDSSALQALPNERCCWKMPYTDPQGNERPLLLILYGDTAYFFDESDGSLVQEYSFDSEFASVNTYRDGHGFVSVLRNGDFLVCDLNRDYQGTTGIFRTEIYSAVMAAGHDGSMAFVAKTDRTKLKLFEDLYDSEREYFADDALYTRPIRTRLMQDRYVAVLELPSYTGFGILDLYDLETEKRIWHAERTFEGYSVELLGMDPSGRYLYVAQGMPYQILIYDTTSQAAPTVFDVKEETGADFRSLQFLDDAICLYQTPFVAEKLTSESRVRFLDLKEDGSLAIGEAIEVPADAGTELYYQFAEADEAKRFVALVQREAGGYNPEKPPVTFLYDRQSEKWLRLDLEAKDTSIAVDHLPSQGLLAATDRQKVRVFDAAGTLLYEIHDASRTVETFRFCPAVGSGLAEDLLLVVSRDDGYRLDRYLASDGTFLGSCGVDYYSSDVGNAWWTFTEGEIVLQMDDVINFIDTAEWDVRAGASWCVDYSPTYQRLVSQECETNYRLTLFEHYDLKDLIRKGEEYLHGLTMTESEKASYGIEGE